ncbi:MAG: BON domain-containing protein [Acidobacteria bacterium]|jgi:hyperosmotically inducible protein|nr:BON domain-containing protein [Acidobacteriota bacterium]
MYPVVIAVIAMLSVVTPAQRKDSRTLRMEADIERELFMLPNYSVFDFLAFRIEPGGTVRLLGQVVRPTLRADAERRVKKVEGVEQVVNAIEVLPVSQSDDAIRQAVARNIYNSTALDRYGFQGQPPIHIIVKQGRVTLEGVVDSESDKTVAGLKAREITGVFEVKNNLSIAQ